ncbi:hypothetical protein [Mycobacterium dioxanotrophicus]|nr:hypothetical protein [Mycobacterium dioxanotrophicus]
MSGTSHGQGSTPDPYGGMAEFLLASTERNMALARRWSDSLLTTFADQSEDARATLSTLTASLEAMERVLASQEETNRALRLSLQGYRQIVDRYLTAQERTARLVQTSVDDLKTAGDSQMEAAKALLTPSAWSAPTEAVAQLMSMWAGAFTRSDDESSAEHR